VLGYSGFSGVAGAPLSDSPDALLESGEVAYGHGPCFRGRYSLLSTFAAINCVRRIVLHVDLSFSTSRASLPAAPPRDG
jgi:hypothetical protein